MQDWRAKVNTRSDWTHRGNFRWQNVITWSRILRLNNSYALLSKRYPRSLPDVNDLDLSFITHSWEGRQFSSSTAGLFFGNPVSHPAPPAWPLGCPAVKHWCSQMQRARESGQKPSRRHWLPVSSSRPSGLSNTPVWEDFHGLIYKYKCSLKHPGLVLIIRLSFVGELIMQ